eukprot:Clim_evm78s108 gene=Clim_evmTU78s108
MYETRSIDTRQRRTSWLNSYDWWPTHSAAERPGAPEETVEQQEVAGDIQTTITDLPYELQRCIVDELDGPTVAQLGGTCKQLHEQFGTDEELWHEIMLRDYPFVANGIKISHPRNNSWRDNYKRAYRLSRRAAALSAFQKSPTGQIERMFQAGETNAIGSRGRRALADMPAWRRPIFLSIGVVVFVLVTLFYAIWYLLQALWYGSITVVRETTKAFATGVVWFADRLPTFTMYTIEGIIQASEMLWYGIRTASVTFYRSTVIALESGVAISNGTIEATRQIYAAAEKSTARYAPVVRKLITPVIGGVRAVVGTVVMVIGLIMTTMGALWQQSVKPFLVETGGQIRRDVVWIGKTVYRGLELLGEGIWMTGEVMYSGSARAVDLMVTTAGAIWEHVLWPTLSITADGLRVSVDFLAQVIETTGSLSVTYVFNPLKNGTVMVVGAMGRGANQAFGPLVSVLRVVQAKVVQYVPYVVNRVADAIGFVLTRSLVFTLKILIFVSKHIILPIIGGIGEAARMVAPFVNVTIDFAKYSALQIQGASREVGNFLRVLGQGIRQGLGIMGRHTVVAYEHLSPYAKDVIRHTWAATLEAYRLMATFVAASLTIAVEGMKWGVEYVQPVVDVLRQFMIDLWQNLIPVYEVIAAEVKDLTIQIKGMSKEAAAAVRDAWKQA